MVTDRRLGRYLGLAFLVVWAGSILSGVLSASIFADSPGETLTNIAAFLLIGLSDTYAAADASAGSDVLALGETLQDFDRPGRRLRPYHSSFGV